MKNSILSQVLDQSARARCKYWKVFLKHRRHNKETMDSFGESFGFV